MNVPADKYPIRGEIKWDAPLASLTSWRVGGRADCLYKPADLRDLQMFLQLELGKKPHLWVGLGSNLLVRDGGVRGTVVVPHGGLSALEREGGSIWAQAGVPCAKLARFAAHAGLQGGEFLAGIPGTVGGALAMNAGAFGGETWSLVRRVSVIDHNGSLKTLDASAFEIAYRQVRLKEARGPLWFVAAEFEFTAGEDPAVLRQRIRRLLAQRAESQPTGVASCGSVFRNPPGDHAGRLIEAAGLKGLRVGGAEVSEKHANFIINRGNATAHDIEALIKEIQARVESRFGVLLQPEVRIVGEPGVINEL